MSNHVAPAKGHPAKYYFAGTRKLGLREAARGLFSSTVIPPVPGSVRPPRATLQ